MKDEETNGDGCDGENKRSGEQDRDSMPGQTIYLESTPSAVSCLTLSSGGSIREY